MLMILSYCPTPVIQNGAYTNDLAVWPLEAQTIHWGGVLGKGT